MIQTPPTILLSGSVALLAEPVTFEMTLTHSSHLTVVSVRSDHPFAPIWDKGTTTLEDEMLSCAYQCVPQRPDGLALYFTLHDMQLLFFPKIDCHHVLSDDGKLYAYLTIDTRFALCEVAEMRRVVDQQGEHYERVTLVPTQSGIIELEPEESCDRTYLVTIKGSAK